ncbi:uncharacterized protein LOC109821496 [Asparagus officinalis]|uniref:uncharacterized protein LOC109821496 n=1 Tax=Asparagus officinalis TaxID=4686 RepID=UPI00098DEE18|nr:uncharacterized protein LOC109821496 [Asparagus officinalis]
MELSHQSRLPLVGPALGGPASFIHLPDEEEGGDESLVGDAEFVPATDHAAPVEERRPPTGEPMVTESGRLSGSPSPSVSALMPSMGDTRLSPTMRILSNPTTTMDSPEHSTSGDEENVDYESSPDGDEVGDDAGDDSIDGDTDDDISEEDSLVECADFNDTLRATSDKASTYISISSPGPPAPMTKEATIVTSPPKQLTPTPTTTPPA